MTLPLPWILWPAPCSPALLGADDVALDLLVLHGGDAAALHAFAAGLALRSVGDGERVLLAVESIARPDAELEARAADALALPGIARLDRARIRLRAARKLTPIAPARVRCLDLVRGDALLRSRAVAVCALETRSLAVAFATDLHLAAIWDELARAIAQAAPDLEAAFLNPRVQLARLVSALNAAADRGEVDAVVLGGDLVDHVYRVPRGRITGLGNESNVPLLVDALASLRVPSFAIPGNHDFRLCPWRPRSYGLAELGIPAARTNALLRAAGLWDAWPMRVADLHALRSHEPDGRSALAQHLLQVAPVTDQRVTLGALDLVFVSTGRDLLPRWRSLDRARLPALLRALRTTWSYPDLEGLRDAQLASIARAFDAAAASGRGVALFQHAPLLHPPEQGGVEARIDRLDPGDDDGLAARVAFERRLHASGLRRGVFFLNPAPLVRALRSARAPVAVFAGHVHRGHAMALRRADGDLRSTSMEAAASDTDRVALVTGPSLGQTDVRCEERPGFLLARFDAGRLAGVVRQTLAGRYPAPAG